ncbi:DEAD/DEAH box helicase family protein [Micromonospora soli]|uniref:DEAD/DEAH box helicase family protein n=1 Tax=Micromonospora sp. NBRC 110009 TaxID=3061627 RepID=UPI00267371F5|nr:DEAD/DEAH box helicase family protein [Micromonospora sp. NBRC 110009]WKT97526.1 DEAD/DEAH box helicase family protein [Micromonospora sp. NBRC 110009]
MMITVDTATRLLDFDRVIRNPQRAKDQLHGAVALHNILQRHRVAYLADEVGMGKTYVALGVVALLRHFTPDLRVLVIAPRENIQQKWQREQRVFTKNNVRLDDLRVRMPGGLPARPLVHCRSLIELVEETAVGPDRDFFVRLPSFSLPMRRDAQQRRNLRDRLCAQVPWLPDDLVDLRANADVIKDRFAQAINAALPHFDLVIVDEAHNLKHGWAAQSSSRNRVLATVLGRDRADVDPRLREKYGPRAGKVLLLSATPLDDDYRQLWNQLDVFGLAEPFQLLRDSNAGDQQRRDVAGEFLIRRVTSLEVSGQRLTKNLYRREWRAGGVGEHDKPIRITDDRQRLTVALVQKKVSELLDDERFGTRFQVGMLASFESFLETSAAKKPNPAESSDDIAEEAVEGNFDDAGQATDAVERQGIDVPMLNDLARDHFQRFGRELPHPKMDSLVRTLATSWRDGRKGLVFVRRVASVTELKRKLDDEYSDWLVDRLRSRLKEQHATAFENAVDEFRRQRSQRDSIAPMAAEQVREDDDAGGQDTFFAWFFRGTGPDGIVSGATIQGRFRNQGSALGTFFDDNHIMALLGAGPGHVANALADGLGEERDKVDRLIREHSRHYLTEAKQATRGTRFDAVQAAALELLAHREGPHRECAEVIWRELYRPEKRSAVSAEADPDLLETTTFFTELRQRPRLRNLIWPEPTSTDPGKSFREQHLRAQLLSAAARLGHAFLDLYVVVTDHLPTLDPSAAIDKSDVVITAYLDELERQAAAPPGTRPWAGLDELAALAEHHELVLDTNLPDARRADLREARSLVSRLFTAQEPVAGMSGRVNSRHVQQFRLPGYPLVLICTDLLQEGEDLHTFCSRVYHYGLAWTPSAIEQRIGRIDRVRSESERRLTALNGTADGDDLLQVYYPHLTDTVERLQVRRVLRRINDFLRLMHEGLILPAAGDGHLDVSREALVDEDVPPPPADPLRTSFPVRTDHLDGQDRPLAVDETLAVEQFERFNAVARAALPDLAVEWERNQPGDGTLLGTVVFAGGRQQPFSLQLEREGSHLVVRCVSPIGRISTTDQWDDLARWSAGIPARLGTVEARGGSYDVTVEEDVLLTAPAYDTLRVAALIRRVTTLADGLEREHLPERDRLLKEFRAELERDVRHAR